jgi:hypothetical protein
MTTRVERISENGHHIVTYSPRRYTKRTLFNRVLKELKAKLPSILENESRKYYSLMLIDLKTKTKKNINNGEPYYTKDGKLNYSYGYDNVKKMYETRYVLPFSHKVRDYYINNEYNPNIHWHTKRINIVRKDKLKQIRDLPEVKYILDKIKKEIEWKLKYEKEYKDSNLTTESFIEKYIFGERYDGGIDRQLDNYMNEKYSYIPKSAKHLPWVKIKVCIGEMNIRSSYTPNWSPLNYKSWGANGKCTNKGLKADTTYSWFSDGQKGGWTFGGMTASELDHYCKGNKISTKGKTYRDLAIEYMKVE